MLQTQVFIEAGVVALVTAIALGLAVHFVGPVMSTVQAGIYGLVIGALIHLGFEVLGGNRWYCANGAACKAA